MPVPGTPVGANGRSPLRKFIPSISNAGIVTMSQVSGKSVIITGASSGIGEATAKLLAEHGAKLMLAARREDRLEKLVAEIESAGGTATYQTVDVTQRNAKNIDALYEMAIQPEAIAQAIRYAIEQPKEVDVNEILIRPTAQEL